MSSALPPSDDDRPAQGESPEATPATPGDPPARAASVCRLLGRRVRAGCGTGVGD